MMGVLGNSKRCSGLFVVIFLACFLSACESVPARTSLPANSEIISSIERYRIQTQLVPGDQLEILVYQHPELSRVVTVRRDGMITVPLLDDVKAAGLTTQALDERLTAALSKRLNQPSVTVIHNNAMEPMVFVLGEVGVAKPIPLRQARTVAQAISYVGGVSKKANIDGVSLIRLDDAGHLSLTPLGKQSDVESAYLSFQNTPLRADDLLVVPEGARSKTNRFLQDYIINPFSALNQILTPYFQILLLEEVDD